MSESSSSTLMEDSSSNSSDSSCTLRTNAKETNRELMIGDSSQPQLEPTTSYLSSPLFLLSTSALPPSPLPTSSSNFHESPRHSNFSSKSHTNICPSHHDVVHHDSTEADTDETIDVDKVDTLGQPLVQTKRTPEEMALWRSLYSEDESDEEEDMSAGCVNEILTQVEHRLSEHIQLIEELKPMTNPALDRNNGTNVLLEPYMCSSDPIVRPSQRSLIQDSKGHRDKGDISQQLDTTAIIPKASKRDVAATLSTHFGLPRTNLTAEIKRDLQLIHMRAVLDQQRMYKKQGRFKVPKFSEMGIIKDDIAEVHGFQSKKLEQRKTLVHDTLELEGATHRFENRYKSLQNRKQCGRKTFYKTLMAKRRILSNRY